MNHESQHKVTLIKHQVWPQASWHLKLRSLNERLSAHCQKGSLGADSVQYFFLEIYWKWNVWLQQSSHSWVGAGGLSSGGCPVLLWFSSLADLPGSFLLMPLGSLAQLAATHREQTELHGVVVAAWEYFAYESANVHVTKQTLIVLQSLSHPTLRPHGL